MSSSQVDSRKSSRSRRIPNAFPEVALHEPAAAWFQMHRAGDWTPGRSQVAALHTDGLGLRMVGDNPIPRGTSMMLNLTLPTVGTLHVRGLVAGSRKEGARHAAVVRFQHPAEVDRQGLLRLVGELSRRGEEQPVPRPDKRRYRRWVRSLPVDYQVRGGDGRLQPGQGQMVTLDIGGGGFKFRVDQALTVGDVLYVRLPLSTDPFFSLGRVAWIEPSRVPGHQLAGLEFVDLPVAEQSRLVGSLAAEVPG